MFLMKSKFASSAGIGGELKSKDHLISSRAENLILSVIFPGGTEALLFEYLAPFLQLA